MTNHVPEISQKKPSEDVCKAYRNLYEPPRPERFPFEFHLCCFERSLGASPRGARLGVTAPKLGPDFRAVVEGRPIYIAAVAPTGSDPCACEFDGKFDRGCSEFRC
jgi:hypothetical protein